MTKIKTAVYTQTLFNNRNTLAIYWLYSNTVAEHMILNSKMISNAA
jgi:hypothetical protein